MRYVLNPRRRDAPADDPQGGARSLSEERIAAPSPAQAMAGGLYGLVRAGQLMAGFAIDAIREVVPLPKALQPWPRTRQEILGSFTLRGCVIPVLDLQSLLRLASPDIGQGSGRSEDEPSVVLIVRDGAHVLGLVISEICGVVRLEEHEISQVREPAPKMPGLVPATFATQDHGGLLLDARALFALDEMPSVRSIMQATLNRSARGEPHLLVEMGGKRIFVAARVIDATVHETEILPAAVDDPLWVGLLSHKGHRIPVIDSLALFGLGRYGPANRSPCLVVRGADGSCVALRIDRVNDMVQLRAQDLLPLQERESPLATYFSAVTQGSDDLQLVVDSEALRNCPQLDALSKLSEPEAATASRAQATNGSQEAKADRRPFLIVQLGSHRYAVPLEQVAEILPQASSRVAISEARGPKALILHRGTAIPVHSLARLLGHAVTASQSAFTVISTDGEGRCVGFEVDELVSVKREPLQTLRRAREGAPLGLLDKTISSEGQIYAVLDLQGLARDSRRDG